MLDSTALEELAELEALDEEFTVAQMVGLFVEQAEACFDDLADAQSVGDQERFTRVAHTMKGSARELGASRLATRSSEVENLGKAGKFAEVMELMVAMAEACCGALVAILDYVAAIE